MWFANGFANEARPHAYLGWSVTSVEASEPPMISSASVVATWRSASRSVYTYCSMVNATSACPIRLLSAFQSIFASRPAVA